MRLAFARPPCYVGLAGADVGIVSGRAARPHRPWLSCSGVARSPGTVQQRRRDEVTSHGQRRRAGPGGEQVSTLCLDLDANQHVPQLRSRVVPAGHASAAAHHLGAEEEEWPLRVVVWDHVHLTNVEAVPKYFDELPLAKTALRDAVADVLDHPGEQPQQQIREPVREASRTVTDELEPTAITEQV